MKAQIKPIIIVSAIGVGLVGVSLAWLIGGGKPDIGPQSPQQIEEYFRSDEFRSLDPNAQRARAREVFGQMMTQRAKEYSKLPPEKQAAYLDNIMDTMRSRRREFEARRRESESERDGPRYRRWPPPRMGPGNIRARSQSIDPTTRTQMRNFFGALRGRMMTRRAEQYCQLPPNARVAYLDSIIDTMGSRRRQFGPPRGGGSRGPGPGRGRRRNRGPERMRARSERLEPETRAKMAEFRQALRERMRERGIDFPNRR